MVVSRVLASERPCQTGGPSTRNKGTGRFEHVGIKRLAWPNPTGPRRLSGGTLGYKCVMLLGMDTKLSEQRSRIMRGVRTRDTAPELALRRALHSAGLRFRLHRRDLPGCPDIVLPQYRIAIMVHGCFWHGCQACKRGQTLPKTNAAWWAAKLQANRDRDGRQMTELFVLGWRVVTVWECATRNQARLEQEVEQLIGLTRMSPEQFPRQ